VVSAALLSVSWVETAVAVPADTNRPVLFVHGYEAWGCPASNGGETFAPMIDFLRQRGWRQDMVTVGYYSCDVDMSDNVAAYGGRQAVLDRDTDLRDLAHRLAWMIWSRYSSKGVGVDIVAHSMGGLIVRWMLYRAQAHERDYPPALLVRSVVTIATPHAGAPFAAFCATEQCQEMAPGSAFLAELSRNAQAPNGSGGTVWNLVASTSDHIVPADSAVAMAAPHLIVYGLPGYGHNDYLFDGATSADAHVTYLDPGGSGWQSSAAGQHALAWTARALEMAG
jgi:triacylglycerol esterase/lipase EstA (alpha/beta hydrolase family)